MRNLQEHAWNEHRFNLHIRRQGNYSASFCFGFFPLLYIPALDWEMRRFQLRRSMWNPLAGSHRQQRPAAATANIDSVGTTRQVAPLDSSGPPLDLLWTHHPLDQSRGGGECQGIGRNGTVNPSCQAITKLISWYFLLICLVCLFLSFFSLFFLPFILRNAQLHNLRAKRCISPSSTVCLHHILWWKKAQHKCPDWAERSGHGGRREAALLWPCIFHTPFLCRLRLNCGSLCVFRCHSRPRMPEWFQNQVKVIRQEWPHRNNISHSHLHLLNWQCLSLCLRVFVLAAVHDPPHPQIWNARALLLLQDPALLYPPQPKGTFLKDFRCIYGISILYTPYWLLPHQKCVATSCVQSNASVSLVGKATLWVFSLEQTNQFHPFYILHSQ